MLKGIIPGPEQLTKKAIMMAITVPEGYIMLTIAVLLDALSLLLFLLSLLGVGIPLSFVITIVGGLTIGLWTVLRPLFRAIMSKAIESISSMVFSVGGGLEGLKQMQGESPPGLQAGKKIAKKGIGLGISAVRFFICFMIKLIPFLGNIFPGWTISVVFTLIEGEINS